MIGYQSSQEIGREQFQKLWEKMNQMSKDLTTHHEIHDLPIFEQGKFLHNDGWGVVYRVDGKLKEYHSLDPIYSSEIPQEVMKEIIRSDLFVLHARKASPGLPVELGMCHPFLRTRIDKSQISLAHNGTINNRKEIKYSQDYSTDGIDSDSLYALLALMTILDEREEGEAALQRMIRELPSYSGVNLICIIDGKLHGMTNYTRYPKYFTLHYLEEEEHLIISSEPLNGFDGWQTLENHEIKSYSM